MSQSAPWLALSTDWQDSEMFDEATHGERLAWICLLCHAKAHGRGGMVRLRKNAFATSYRLSERAVEGMLERAQKCAAIEAVGDCVKVVNWAVYQAKASKAGVRHGVLDSSQKPQKPEKGKKGTTKHRSPSTAPSTDHSSFAATPPADKTRKRTPRDDLWDTVADIWFGGKVPTKSRTAVGTSVTSFTELGATPDEIRKRYENGRQHWQGRSITARVLIDNWGAYAEPPDGRPDRHGPQAGRGGESRSTNERPGRY